MSQQHEARAFPMARPREEAMNPAALPAWLIAVLIALFVIAPSTAHYLDDTSAELTAQVTQDRADELAAINNPKE